MALRFRPMQPKDVRECVQIIANHPVIGPRYGRSIRDLPKVWLRLMGCEAVRPTIFEAAEGSRAPICCVGVTLFVNDEFVRELKAPPSFWVGPELVQRVLRSNSPILSDRQVQEGNSRGGLNLLVWEGCFRWGLEKNHEIQRLAMDTFIKQHRGFLLKEVVAPQMESIERLQWTLRTGGMLWDPLAGRYEKSLKEKDPKEIIGKPHLIGVAREIIIERADSWSASWVGALFDYQPPRFGFSRSEQRLLEAALAGESGTDRELAESLAVSLPTIKKMWLSIYRRVNDHQPGTIRDCVPVEVTERGKEKRRPLLTYLREHPEELRPASRKLLGRQSLVAKRIHRVRA